VNRITGREVKKKTWIKNTTAVTCVSLFSQSNEKRSVWVSRNATWAKQIPVIIDKWMTSRRIWKESFLNHKTQYQHEVGV
jgi:hypothetical protein